MLFTDIVGSTELAVSLGDAHSAELLRRHDDVLGEEVARHRGRVVKSLGDGVLALFDGPSRALGCAMAVSDAVAGAGPACARRASCRRVPCCRRTRTSAGSSSISRRGSPPWPRLTRCWRAAPFATSRSAPAFALESRGEQVLKGLAGSRGGYTQWQRRERAGRNTVRRDPGLHVSWPQAPDGGTDGDRISEGSQDPFRRDRRDRRRAAGAGARLRGAHPARRTRRLG